MASNSAEGVSAPPPSLMSNLKAALKGRLATEESNDAGDQVEAPACSSDDTDDRPCVLLTNENGIHSAGLRALVRSLLSGGFCNVYICAPSSENTEVGPSTTKQKTLDVCRVDFDGAIAFEVSGPPTDCVSLGLSGVLFPKKPCLVICGISRASNCGFQIYSSALVAGARQAFICDVPSLALSLEWKNMESHEDDYVAAAGFCLPLIRAAVSDSQNGHLFKGFFLNINMPTPFSQNKGLRITKQGTSRPTINWRVLPSQKSAFGMGLCKQNAIGVRVAELGLAASAVAAARRANSSLKNIEVESVAGPTNGSHVPSITKKHHFLMEVSEMVGDADDNSDFGALQNGFVSVTPLGLRNDADVNLLSRVADWVGSSLKLDSPQAL